MIYAILITYILLASYLISKIEDWPLQNGLYFVMMSVLTIGFGGWFFLLIKLNCIDLMPLNDNYILIIILIIIIGLIVTTTCIDTVGAYYINQLHSFGRQFNNKVI